MKQKRFNPGGASFRWLMLAVLFFATTILQAGSLSINVVDQFGAPVTGFRYLVQEDATFHPTPGVTGATDILSLDFHASYHPIAQEAGAGVTGFSDTATTDDGTGAPTINLSGNPATPQYYYVSVQPYAGYSISGAPVLMDSAAETVAVTVQKHPIPTTQISIYLFHDNSSINGAPDLPEELNPPALDVDGNPDPNHVDWTQFSLFLEEPGGRYGMAGGQVIQDAFGNPLGTTYIKGCDASGLADADLNTNYGCFDPVTGEVMVDVLGDGTMRPNPDGTLTVKNLAPAKYGVILIPPTNSGWQQTTTIEGTKVIDAWVKANEPPVFVEFGPPGPHVFIGWVRPSSMGGFPPFQPPADGENIATVKGVITNMHMSRPPNFQFFSGHPIPDCWVGVNELIGNLPGRGLYAEPCAADSSFSIDKIPPGAYQLKVFDSNLDMVISTLGFSVDPTGGTCNGGQSCDFQDVPIFSWFARQGTTVFKDDDQDGFRDPSEIGIGPESQGVFLRWRDGTMYQAFPTDNAGEAPFDEVFPFFHWLVAEVDFANKKATGATFVIDAGGAPDPAYGMELTPQPQCVAVDPILDPDGPTVSYDPATNDCPMGSEADNPNTTDHLSRTETGQVLTQAFQGFLGQKSVLEFGKVDYLTFTPPNFGTFPPTLPEYVGENGGISGIVYYAVTRAEDDPQFAAAEEWEPGIPRVQVTLYADGDIDSFPLGDFAAGGVGDVDWNQNGNLDADDNIIDDLNGNNSADIDNLPLGNFPGPEDLDANGDGIANNTDLADVDNPPLGWADGSALMGPEDIDRNGNLAFDLGDAMQVTWTDSWDDSKPAGCQGATFYSGTDVNLDGLIDVADFNLDPTLVKKTDCYDGLRNFNQLRPGVFDGGYAFADYDMAHVAAVNPAAADAINNYLLNAEDRAVTSGANADTLQLGIIPGEYLVSADAPSGYSNIRSQDRNVDFGDEYIPSAQALPVACVGTPYDVPQLFAMLTKDGSGDAAMALPGVEIADADNHAPFALQSRPDCNLKKVPLSPGQNAAAEFFMKTSNDVSPVANIAGVMLNDLANEFNPNSPAFGEKFAPPTLPVAFYDWAGKEVNRIYADEFGSYNAVVPSTSTANLPMPSGMSPNMLIACMNDAGPIPNPAYNPASDPDNTGIDANGNIANMVDPAFDPQYSQFCYTFQYMPGVITYLDTPVVPIAAFAGPGQFPVDCEKPTLTPMVASVKRRNNSGGGGPFVLPGQQIRIRSMGQVDVPNPEWDGTNATPRAVTRNYNFGGNPGATGGLFLEAANGVRTQVPVGNGPWTGTRIDATIPAGVAPGEYQVIVVRGSGVAAPVESPIGVTLTVGVTIGDQERAPRANFDGTATLNNTANVWNVPGDFVSIQEAIDNAAAGDLIMVGAGVYNELVIMDKAVKLQGWGAAAVTINARQSPTEKIIAWRDRVAATRNITWDPLPGQENLPGAFPGLAEANLPTEEGAGIIVLGKRTGADRFIRLVNRNARIDGFTVIGASTGGGIVVNGYNEFLRVSNNRVTANAGFYGGGIRVGHPAISHEILTDNDPDFDPNDPNSQIGDRVYDDAHNDRVNLHHNLVVKNGGFGGAGGGISLHTGADNYRVQKNWVCGNFTQGNGAGIGHLGFSHGGVIEDNQIIFNESFSQATSALGGGVFVGGQTGLVPESETGLLLSPGSGTVVIDANTIRGNLAGAGAGGGIAIQAVNGHDIAANLDTRNTWRVVNVFNNMITNNVAGHAAGGISIADSLRVNIRNNTVAHNESTSTAALAFTPGFPNVSNALPSGIVSNVHSPDMRVLMAMVNPDALPAARDTQWRTFSDPVLRDDIIYHNRSFFWSNFDDPTTVITENGLLPATCDTPAVPAGNPLCDIALVSPDDYSADLAVLDGNVVTADLQNPLFSLLLNAGTPYHGSNTFVTGEVEGFVNGYYNGARENTLLFPEFTVLQTAGAFDEGGNFIQLAYGPLSLVEPDTNPDNAEGPLFDYHLMLGSAAINGGGNTPATGRLSVDIDNEARTPAAGQSDIGADEAM